MKKILFVFGTRPEGIKMAPLIKAFQKETEHFNVKICITAQHREMLDQVLDFFSIIPDYDLDLMKPGQSLSDVTARVLIHLEPVLKECQPDIVFVQGDTTTVMAGALASFYQQIPVAHLEAGLRTGNKLSPYPEEINRILTGHIAEWHFAPTFRAADNLKKESIVNNVHVVGNTVIDALLLGLEIIKEKGEKHYLDFFNHVDFSKPIVLVTGHRRESFGAPFENMCSAIRDLSVEFPHVEFVYPVHFNPNVRETVDQFLRNLPNVKLIDPLDYPYMIWFMNKSHIVLTDSGGIQEEAPTLGKPVLVMRDVTERQEGVEAGTARLVGTDYRKITDAVRSLLNSKEEYEKMANAVNPYGDGTSSQKIVEILK